MHIYAEQGTAFSKVVLPSIVTLNKVRSNLGKSISPKFRNYPYGIGRVHNRRGVLKLIVLS